MRGEAFPPLFTFFFFFPLYEPCAPECFVHYSLEGTLWCFPDSYINISLCYKRMLLLQVPFYVITHNITLHSHYILDVNALDNYQAYYFSLPLCLF